MLRRLYLVALLLAGLTTLAHATVPSTMSYQGVLTDNLGNLQPDGLYNFTFRIYTVGAGGSAIWTENDANVQVTRGSFAVTLGNVTPLALPFDVPYYLGISVNGQAELAPRTALASSPYGLSLRLPFVGAASADSALFRIVNGGAGPDIAADHWAQIGSSNRSGSLSVKGFGTSNDIASLYDYGLIAGPEAGTGIVLGGGALSLFDKAGAQTFFAEPDVDGLGAGYLFVNGNSGGNGFVVNGNDGTGNPDVEMLGTYPSKFLTGQAGDASVQLPAGAIDANEILDEPGIAQGKYAGQFTVTSTGTMADVTTTTIVIPAPGYIVLTAHAQAGFSGTTADNHMIAQIDDTAGGGEISAYSEDVGGGFATVGSNWIPYSNVRTYYEASPGTYTFRFEAEKGSVNGTCWFWNPTLTAAYFPTSYGTVTQFVSQSDAARFASPQTVTITSQDGGTSSMARVDLRDLELQVAREQARLAEAQERLRQAKLGRQAAPDAKRIEAARAAAARSGGSR